MNCKSILSIVSIIGLSSVLPSVESDASSPGHHASVLVAPEACAFDPWLFAEPQSPENFPTINKIYRGQLFRILSFIQTDESSTFDCRLRIEGPRGEVHENATAHWEVEVGQTICIVESLLYEIAFNDDYPDGTYTITFEVTDTKTGLSTRATTSVLLSEFVINASFDDESHYYKWINHYYRHPDLAEATAAFLYMADLPFNWDSLEQNTLLYLQTAFYDTAFKNNKWVIPHATSIFTTAYPEIRRKSAFLFGCLNNAPRDLYTQLGTEIQAFANWAIDFNIPDTHSEKLTGLHVDIEWARFFASGRYEPVRRVAELLNPKDITAPDHALNSINKDELLESVKWSLQSNCNNHPLVAAYCRYISEDDKMSESARQYLKDILSDSSDSP